VRDGNIYKRLRPSQPLLGQPHGPECLRVSAVDIDARDALIHQLEDRRVAQVEWHAALASATPLVKREDDAIVNVQHLLDLVAEVLEVFRERDPEIDDGVGSNTHTRAGERRRVMPLRIRCEEGGGGAAVAITNRS
jgi:hypothetical protein